MEKIELKNIYKSFIDPLKREKKVLDNVSLEFVKDSIYVIKGESGIGKSTLINIIGLLDSAAKGKVVFDGTDYSNKSDLEKNKLASKNISYVSQNINIDFDLTCYENLLLVCSNNEYINSLLDEFEISGLKNNKALLLSKGEKARLGIIRCILEGKSIWLIDEPCANLDDKTSRTVFSKIEKYSKNKIVIIISHDSVSYEYEKYFEIYMSIEGLSIQEKGNTISRDKKEIIASKNNKIPFNIMIKHAVTLLKNSIWRLLILLVYSVLYTFVVIFIFSFLNVNANRFIKESSEQLSSLGINYINVNSREEYGGYRRAIIPFSIDDETLELPCLFSTEDKIDFKGTEFYPKEGEIYISKMFASKYSLTISDTLYINEMPISIHIYEDDNRLYYDNVLEKFDNNPNRVDFINLMNTAYPCFVSNKTIKNYLASSNIEIDTGSFREIQIETFNLCGMEINVDKIKLSTNVENTQTTLLISDALMNVTGDVLYGLEDMSFEVDNEKIMLYANMITVDKVQTYTVDYIFDSILILNYEVSTKIINDYYNSGIINEDYQVLPLSRMNELDFDNDDFVDFGLLEYRHVLMVRQISEARIWFILGLVAITALCVLFYFYMFVGLKHSYKNNNNLLYLIGYNNYQRNTAFILPCALIQVLALLGVSIVYLNVWTPINEFLNMIFNFNSANIFSISLITIIYILVTNMVFGYGLSLVFTFVSGNRAAEAFKKDVQ